jgi:hypothetical protein
MTYGAPICSFCQHFNANGERLTCRAFPAGIPDSILESRADHRQPVAGDGGIQFQAKDADGEKYAARLFDEQPTSRAA